MKLADSVQYAAFKLRFRALIIDSVICVGLFLVGALIAGIVFEDDPAARVSVFIVLVLAILCYEPFMVSRYGGTLGHQKGNIRIVCSRNLTHLPIWRAATRSILKNTIGILSFVFMFFTNRAQSFHDLVAGARVIIRNPEVAGADDFFTPADTPLRLIIVIGIYNVGLLILLSMSMLFVSDGCLNYNACSDTESQFVCSSRFSAALGSCSLDYR